MDIIKLIQSLDISPGELSLWAAAILTLIQIAPIKVDPWTWIAKKIGAAINGEVITKVDNLEGKITELEAKVKAVGDKEDERSAVNSRVRILRFNDELQEGRRHSKDSFDQVLSDITDYNTYCDEHPKFKNSQTAATVSYIEKIYAERLEKHDFL